MDSIKESKAVYKTQKSIDGKEDIELTEHEEIVKNLTTTVYRVMDLDSVLREIDSIVGKVSSTSQKMEDTLKELEQPVK